MTGDKGSVSLILNKSLILDGLSHTHPEKVDSFVDWTGVIYPNNSFPILPKETFTHLNPAEVGDGFRAGANEWIAFGIAAKIASVETTSATVVELGASQGLWCISWVKYFLRVMPTNPVIALGVEAGDAGEETLKFWNANYELEFLTDTRLNRIILKSRYWKFDWLRRAVSDKSGTYWFPKVDVSRDNGKHVMLEPGSNSESLDEVEAITPVEILQELTDLGSRKISLLHLDLQGAELKLLESNDFYSLCAIADVIMLGTHSSEIELKAHIRLRGTHTLLISEPCEYVYEPNHSALIKDGEQVWINNDALEIARNLGLINTGQIDTEEIIASYGYKVAQSRELVGMNFSKSSISHSGKVRVEAKPWKNHLIRILSLLHLAWVARKIVRFILRRK